MKKVFKIYVANKTYAMYNKELALNYAKRESLVGGRVAVFEDGKKIATYGNGKEI